MSEIAARLRQEVDAPLAPMVQTLLVEAGIPAARRPQAGLAILRDQIGSAPISPCWLLRLRPDAPFWQHVRQALLTRHLLVFSSAYIASACVSVTAWWIVGGAALEGRFDAGTLVAWTFLLLMLVPLALVAAWSQGVVAIGAGGLLKLRLLYGALRLEPDETRHDGVGKHLARVIESESIESLMLAAGFAALATGVDLLLTAAIFVAASQITHLLLFVVTLLVTSVLGCWYFKRLQQWTDARLHMTQDLAERMVGHRTRLAQEPPSRWHEGEDELLERYLVLSSRMILGRPGVLGRAALLDDDWDARARAIVCGRSKLSRDVGDRLGSYPALDGGACQAHGGFCVRGWGRRCLEASQAAARGRAPARGRGRLPSLRSSISRAKASHSGPLVVAKDSAFRFRDRAESALQDCSFRIPTATAFISPDHREAGSRRWCHC